MWCNSRDRLPQVLPNILPSKIYLWTPYHRVQASGVAVLTPTTSAGRQWNSVFVVGVQEGVWPNTRLRGQLLHTQELVEEVTGTAGQQPINERIAQVRHDELRTFAAAISRASNRLIATAVADADHQP